MEYYQTKFQIVEINATFYRFFKDQVFINWRLKAKKNFKYIIKVNRTITHIKYLKNCKRLIKKFCRSVALLEDKLALILLQLPPKMPYDLERLKKALLSFDDPTKVVVEFRDEKWYTPEVKALLKEIGCIFCAADSPKIKLLNWVTSDIAYIRLHGRKTWFNYNYSTKELTEIAAFVKKLAKNKVKHIYILFNNDYFTYAVKNAAKLEKMLGL